MIDWLKEVDWGHVWTLCTTVVVASSAVVKATKNKWDDRWHGKLMNLLALNPKK